MSVLVNKNGCCADREHNERAKREDRPSHMLSPRACNEGTCMTLPEGQTCSTCAHCERCVAIFGAKPENTSCGFFPRRFYLRTVDHADRSTP